MDGTNSGLADFKGSIPAINRRLDVASQLFDFFAKSSPDKIFPRIWYPLLKYGEMCAFIDRVWSPYH